MRGLVCGIGGPGGTCRLLSASGSLCLRVSWQLSNEDKPLSHEVGLRRPWLFSSSNLERGLNPCGQWPETRWESHLGHSGL